MIGVAAVKHEHRERLKEGERSFAGPTTPPRSPNLTSCVGVVRRLLQNSEGDEDR